MLGFKNDFTTKFPLVDELSTLCLWFYSGLHHFWAHALSIKTCAEGQKSLPTLLMLLYYQLLN
ncbi:hypothetical protein [Dyadobacter sp. CY356]|uniref:hypothetical protein n=1 Tax=Dyadobacter sp. CY356 TaxID=2906442 RepID=UPI001F44661A|nr:hypothetical protein [Dyadobacter sp. CY356]MCF0059148.1 hypothetical protein [Dyadobacter sp. CY356]